MENKRTILYVCYFLTAVIESYVHRCREEKDSSAILLVYNSFKKDNRLKEVFNKVVYADDASQYHFGEDEKNIEEGIINYYDKVLLNNSIKLDEIDEIYMSCDMLNDFAIYCSFYKKSYQLFEYGNNQLTDDRWKLYEWHIVNKNVHGSANYFRVAQKHHSICSLSPYCVQKWIHVGSSKEKYSNGDYIEYDFAKELLNLQIGQKEILVDCFDNDEVGIRNYCERANGSIMILTQRQWQYPVTEIETGVLYQYYVDYFFQNNGLNKISIKPHPSDTWKHNDFFEKSNLHSIDKALPFLFL